MDLQLDEQQELLRQTLDRFLERRLPFDVRQKQRSAEAFLEFWKLLNEELGIAAAGLPESAGGFGGGPESEMIVAASLGRSLAVTPYSACQVASATLLDELGAGDALQAIAEGAKLVTLAIEEPHTRGDVSLVETVADPTENGWKLSGTKLAVEFAAQADIILIPARLLDGYMALFVVERETLSAGMKPFALIDDMPAADLLLDDTTVSADTLIASGEAVLPALEKAISRTLAALCAEASQVANVMVEDTVAYTKERQQFGVPIASFQALQHRMVDMWTKAREIEAASLLATLKVDDTAAVSAAKVTVAEGLRLIGQEAVQMHGAMGLTEELRVGRYFKRATVLEHKLGSASDHVERYRLSRKVA